VQVKAAGGVRTLDAILAVIDAGVTRCGATATKVILDEFAQRQQDGKAAQGDAQLGGGY
jgi:deoxyribose-phosphate aldolase